jgi:predicted transcriptional regulator
MMTTMDDIPSHYINKAGIAKRLGISRVTVDRALTKISKDPTLSAILNVFIVSEGKRTLYFYEPSDVDSVFEQLQRSSRSRSKTVHSTNRSVTRKSTDQSFELLERDVQHLQKLLS